MVRAWVGTGLVWAIAALASAQSGNIFPARLRLDPTGNDILEPGETAAVWPYWRNPNPFNLFGALGTLANLSGPAGASHVIVDVGATYGAFPPSSPPQTCVKCYSLRVTAATRPVHWDDTVVESVLVGSITSAKTWTLHVGATFDDVPPTSAFYRFVETIVHKDVTAGCTTTAHCPAAQVSREGMAVFLLVAREPRGYTPTPCGATPLFSDMPVSSPFCAWVEELARRGIVGGCGGGMYCPAAAVTRQEMAVFLLAGGPIPPACAAAPFLDVPVASPYCPWIRDLVAMGVTAGCGNGNYCPTAPVTREQMSVFLTTRFGLLLYGV